MRTVEDGLCIILQVQVLKVLDWFYGCVVLYVMCVYVCAGVRDYS